MDDTCLLVFTSRTIQRMTAEGGSYAWVLDAQRARTCRYLVCSWNSTGEFADTTEGHKHGEAFLIAPIQAVEVSSNQGGRYGIRFSEFARIHVPNVWSGKRNPVNYTTLGELGIDPETLEFEQVTSPASALDTDTGELDTALLRSRVNDISSAPLSIRAAKPRLAAYYEVQPEAVEITIRG